MAGDGLLVLGRSGARTGKGFKVEGAMECINECQQFPDQSAQARYQSFVGQKPCVSLERSDIKFLIVVVKRVDPTVADWSSAKT